jgi:hypothetical protein
MWVKGRKIKSGQCRSQSKRRRLSQVGWIEKGGGDFISNLRKMQILASGGDAQVPNECEIAAYRYKLI